MKTLFLITATFVICSFNSHSQENVTEPFPVERIMKSNLKEHKLMWSDLGYTLYKTNYTTCVLTFELKEKSIVSFVEFKENWNGVDEVRIVFTEPETYNKILEYYIENIAEEKTDGVSRFFVHPSFTAVIGFSIREHDSGKLYMIRLTAI